jgi:septal ring-binding cell division protein DamX
LLDARLAATETWLASQPADTFTIQLTGSDSTSMLKRYLADLGRSMQTSQIFVFRTRASGRPSMTVTYGSFPGRKVAMEALQALPADLKRDNPLLRSVKGIRAEVRQALSQPGQTAQ